MDSASPPVTGHNEGLWTATGCSWLNQGGTTELLKPPSLGVGMEAFLFEIAENAFPQRSWSRASLRRTGRVRLGRPLPAALLEDILSSLTRLGEVKS